MDKSIIPRALKVLEAIIEHDMIPYEISSGSMQTTKKQMTEIMTDGKTELFHLAYARDTQELAYYRISRENIPLPLRSKKKVTRQVF